MLSSDVPPVQQLAIGCIGGSQIASISIADKNVRSPIDAGLWSRRGKKYTHCNEWSETFPMVVGKAVCCSCSLRYPPRSASHKQQSAQFQEVLGLANCAASSISPSLVMADSSPRTHWEEWSELFPVDIVLAVVRCTPVQQLAINCIGGSEIVLPFFCEKLNGTLPSTPARPATSCCTPRVQVHGRGGQLGRV